MRVGRIPYGAFTACHRTYLAFTRLECVMTDLLYLSLGLLSFGAFAVAVPAIARF
jgi:hypothetical protein